MGGGYYDRDVGRAASSGQGYSYASYFSWDAEQAMAQKGLHASLDPLHRTLKCSARNPVVIAMDVTGSMGTWSKVIYDKMPMFYGQLMLQGYLEDPAVSFAAVGDAFTDRAPLQVCDFEQGDRLDPWLTKVWLEGNGGGQGTESYELMAYFYARHTVLERAEKSFFFFTGDEGFCPQVAADAVRRHVGDVVRSLDARQVFAELKRKFEVFLLHKNCFESYGHQKEQGIVAQWREVLGERVLLLDDPKAVVDVMLGAVALLSGARDLGTYLDDMRGRDQDTNRLDKVEQVLAPVQDSVAIVKSDPVCLLPAPASRQGVSRSFRF